jgi:biotin transport system substrate-specific component
MTSSTTVLSTFTARLDSTGTSRMVKGLSVLLVAGATAAAAQISVPLPFTQVPLTFQPMVVLLGGLVLGARLGAVSQILYLAAGIAGLPVFATSLTLPPGALRLMGPTGGYLMAYPLAAFVAGWLAERGLGRRYLTSVIAMVAGLAVIYASGALWLGLFARTASDSVATGLGAALVTGVYPFVIPDLLKLAAAAAVVPGVWRVIGRQY